jgi:hypothetical protein
MFDRPRCTMLKVDQVVVRTSISMALSQHDEYNGAGKKERGIHGC